MGDLTLPQIKFPLMGEGFCVQSTQKIFEPQAVCTSKQVIEVVFTTQSQVKSPSMGPTFQVKLDQVSSGATH